MAVALAGARVLLTGASGGIGQAIARRLRVEGSELLLSGRRAEVLEALAVELGGGACALAADLASRESVAHLLAAAGTVDVLVANAALPASGRLLALEQNGIDRALEVNLRAPLALARGLAPAMVARGRGQIVLVGSLQGRAATAGASVYNASKFALRGFALALRAELAPSGVGVSLVAPGFIRDAGMYADTGIALPRYVTTRTADDVAAAVVRAITRDRAEVDVATLSMRIGADIAGLAPSLAARVTRALGGERLAREFEERQADKR